MSVETTAMSLRAKIIGALIRDARLAAQKPIEECAGIVGVSVQDFEAYELGMKAISLPELEAVAYHLHVPLDHFWDRETLVAKSDEKSQPNMIALIRLRHRMVGAMMRQARLEARISLQELAEHLGIEIPQLEAYELGMEPVPFPMLEHLSGVLNRSIREFQDQKGPVGVWNAQQRAIHDFLALPLNIQTFITKPVNRPYLDLAVRLSEMSADKLRAVAEGLLEITY
jgi:transcriptional regulator with XRE-family HTH domain